MLPVPCRLLRAATESILGIVDSNPVADARSNTNPPFGPVPARPAMRGNTAHVAVREFHVRASRFEQAELAGSVNVRAKNKQAT